MLRLQCVLYRNEDIEQGRCGLIEYEHIRMFQYSKRWKIDREKKKKNEQEFSKQTILKMFD